MTSMILKRRARLSVTIISRGFHFRLAPTAGAKVPRAIQMPIVVPS